MAKKVMIIDDNDNVLRISELLIESFGYSPIPVNDPREGLRILSEDPPSLILLDLMMSPMDGSGFLDERRKIPGALEIPVVICSAWRLTEEELAPYKDEIVGVVTKPVEPTLLRETLKNHLGA
ncbi:MAG: response regulator [Methanoculleus bourgensis]|uniref:Response regulator n=1 Tax=Methanoculleus bourgensis TaxID=83986 RepID=A0A8T7H472_9EURY|nr:response regulator [Methanoculleus bourgensis]